MATTPAERSQRGKLAAYTSWGNTLDWTARTANARNAFENKFLAEANGDPQRAEALRKAYFARLSLKSAQARRRRSERDRKALVEQRIAQLDSGGGGGNAA